jgi:hypothetical protein
MPLPNKSCFNLADAIVLFKYAIEAIMPNIIFKKVDKSVSKISR